MARLFRFGLFPGKRQQALGRELALDVRLDGDGGEEAHPLPIGTVGGFALVVPSLDDVAELLGCEAAEVVEREVDAAERYAEGIKDGQRLFFSSEAPLDPPSRGEEAERAAAHWFMSSGEMASAKSMRDISNGIRSAFEAEATQQ